MKPLMLALWLLLSVGSAWAQATLSGTVRDSLTHKPLPFASVFLANTTLGATTNERGQFVLARVPAGSYDLVASYVGYRLAKRPVRVGAGPMPSLPLALLPETAHLGEVVVRGKKHVNRPEDYRRFVELFVGRTTFSQQCRILNPEVVRVDYDPNTKELAATADEPVVLENQALGYRIKCYGLHLRADLGHGITSYYGQPVFEVLTPRSRHQRWRWESNRVSAYQGSLTHFLKSLYHNQIAAEGFLVQKVRFERNPTFARADSLRRQLLRHMPPAGLSHAAQDSLARWGQVMPTLMLLYRTPRPIDSLRRVAADGRVFLRFSNCLQISYQREVPDPLFPGAAVSAGGAARPQVSRIYLLVPEAEVQPTGHLLNPLAIYNEEYWAFEKMGEFLPLDYAPPPFFHP